MQQWHLRAGGPQSVVHERGGAIQAVNHHAPKEGGQEGSLERTRHTRISSQRMMQQLAQRSLAQSQKNKIEHLLQKARDRYSFNPGSVHGQRRSPRIKDGSKGQVPDSLEEKVWREMQERAL